MLTEKFVERKCKTDSFVEKIRQIRSNLFVWPNFKLTSLSANNGSCDCNESFFLHITANRQTNQLRKMSQTKMLMSHDVQQTGVISDDLRLSFNPPAHHSSRDVTVTDCQSSYRNVVMNMSPMLTAHAYRVRDCLH